MSLCVIIQDKERIIIGADSRESIKIDNELYATGRNEKKTRIIGNQVIFSTGNAYVASNILNEYESSKDYTIANLEKIKNRHVDQFVKVHGVKYFSAGHELKHVIGLIVCYRYEDKNMIYALSSGDSEITEIIDESVRIADGSRSDEALKLLRKYENIELLQAYQKIYNDLADEGIGGELTVYLIDRLGIRAATFPIIDNRSVRVAPQNVLWTREQGIVIEREDHVSKAVFNSDEIAFFVNGERKLWLDVQNETYMFSGTLKAADGIFAGTLQAVDGIFTGTLQAADGTFTGTLQGADGTFSGTISASTITGGQITGTFINGATVTGSTVSTRVGNGRGIVLNSGWADLEIYSGVNSANVTFAIRDLLGDTSVVFERNGDISAINGDLSLRAERIFINAPGGVYVNGVQIG
jgi:hypothetical protein